jgi:periplasmic copper chaperone A
MSNTTFSLRALACTTLLALTPAPSLAHDYKLGSLAINHPWSRATPGSARVAGGFMKITNAGTESDRLIGGTSEASKIIEIHEMIMDGNVMKMRALEKGLEIKPGASIELKPGSYHVMFIDLTKPFKEGESVKGELIFEKAGRIAVEYTVENRGAKAAGGTGHDAHATHGDMKTGAGGMKK